MAIPCRIDSEPPPEITWKEMLVFLAILAWISILTYGGPGLLLLTIVMFTYGKVIHRDSMKLEKFFPLQGHRLMTCHYQFRKRQLYY
jgi:hypothetical protein